MIISYSITFPQIPVQFDESDLTFSIGHIKSRMPSVIEMKLHCYDMTDTLLKTYTASRWVITTDYTHQECTFTVESDVQKDCIYVVPEIITFGVDNENPLWFSELMLNHGEFTGYHSPSELATSSKVNFINNSYANMYDKDGNYLQVIRPNKESFHTDRLDGAEITILAPHFNDDSGFDNDVSVFIEALNQTEQTINVLR
jgi:hypothetical protein